MSKPIINPINGHTISGGIQFISLLWTTKQSNLMYLTNEDLADIWKIVDKYDHNKLANQRIEAQKIKNEKEEAKRIKDRSNS